VQNLLRRNGEKDEELVERRQVVVLDNIRDNDEAGAHYRQVMKLVFNGQLTVFSQDLLTSERKKTHQQ
jgi:hypothetical protein